MPTKGKRFSVCCSRSHSNFFEINRNSPCDGYFGCDDDLFEEGKKGEKKSKTYFSHLPWIKRKSPPVLSFFKRMASIRRSTAKPKPKQSNVNYYRTLPDPREKSLYFGYKCFLVDSGVTSMKKNYCCDGYFGCPPTE